MKRGVMVLVAVLGLSLGLVCPAADFIGDEFPITATAGNEFGIYAAFDGTNYLVGIQGDAAGQKKHYRANDFTNRNSGGFTHLCRQDR